MELEVLLSVTGFHPAPDDSSSYLSNYLFKMYSSIILPSMPTSSKWSFPLDYSD